MEKKDNIFNCYISISLGTFGITTKEEKSVLENQGKVFRSYIFGENGLCNRLKSLCKTIYGHDLDSILLMFYVNPTDLYKMNLREIERYRKKERGIRIPIIIDESNFFNKSIQDRNIYMKETLLFRLNLLRKVVLSNKLDTNVDLLIKDVKNIIG